MPGSGAAEFDPGSGGLRAADPGGGDAAPSDLQDYLAAELARMGKDPSSTASSAPTGADNAVFDLDAEIIDPDGEGGDPPTGIKLSWTEQLVGDYDQNGLVNASDLTPLGANWNETVEYDDASLHGGFQYWPNGDPDDGGTGAANWRLARIDGNRDGQLYQYDITPIAVHWQERLSHYRVYAKAPGESDFTLVETQAPERSGTAPVRCSYDAAVADDGVYSFYVAPYDDASGEEGPPSGVVYADIVTGDINYSPVASLTVTPGYGNAPQEITLDASASYDLDGSIEAYQWDLDGDGLVDWISTDPVPDASSNGTVKTISQESSGVVTATYTQGGSEWIYPSVVAIDDKGAQSSPASARLGIGGWEYEIISSTNPDFDPAGVEVGFEIKAFAENPQTGELVLAGQQNDLYTYSDAPEGVYWATRLPDGTWDQKLVFGYDHPLWKEWSDSRPHARTYASGVHIAGWDADGYPLFLISGFSEATSSLVNRVYSARHDLSKGWVLEEVFRGTAPETHSQRGASVIDTEPNGTSAYVALIRDTEEASGIDNYRYRDYLYWFSEGEGVLEDTQWVADQDNSRFSRQVELLNRDEVVTAFYGSPEPRDRSIWWRRRIDIDQWVEEQAAKNTSIQDSGYYVLQVLEVTETTGMASLIKAVYDNPDDSYYAIALNDGPNLHEYSLKELGTWVDVDFFSEKPSGVVEAFCWARYVEPNSLGYYIRIENGKLSKEVFYTESMIGQYGSPVVCLATSGGQLYAVISEYQGALGPTGLIQLFGEKADPRL